MKKVLIFASYYLPGYKAGGPIKSIRNLLSALQEKAEFYLITSDRDIGDTEPYSDIPLNTWVNKEGIFVNYLSPGYRYLKGIYQALTNSQCDTVYFNSLFSFRFTILPLFICRILNTGKRIIVAPRGELGTGALRLKQRKKTIFIACAKAIGLYRNVTWHATSKQEMADIAAFAGRDSDIRLAANITALNNGQEIVNRSHTATMTRLVFLSRISPKKNLLTLLLALKQVKSEIALDIYGPLEDTKYWQSCEQVIAELSTDKHIRLLGPVNSERVVATLAQYNVFVLPTRNENFGHVILEALEAGCYVMTTTDTPWSALTDMEAGFIFRHDDGDALARAIEDYAAKSSTEKLTLSNNARDYFQRYIREQQAVSDMVLVLDI